MTVAHVKTLDGWRGVAVLSLLIGHFFPYWRLSLGLFGVNLFFVLSGLLMAQLLFQKQTPIDLFYKRRIARIFPTLFVFITTVLVVYGVAGWPISGRETFGAVALVRNYYPVGFGNAVPFDHTWSLSVEEHAYIVLSAIALASRCTRLSARWAVLMVIAVAVVMAAWYSLTYAGADLHAERLIRSEVSVFGIFCSALLVIHFDGKTKPALPAWVFPALALLALTMHYHTVPRFFTLAVGVAALAVLVNGLDQAPAWMQWLLSTRPLRQLGVWSYSLYLWQQPFYVMKDKHVLSAPLAFLCAVLTGVLSYYLVEKPARASLNRRWRPAQPGPATTGRA